MKILITESIDKNIDGYYVLPVIHGSLKINEIPRNACESIFVDQCVDKMKELETIKSLCGKLRKQGIIVITGVDILVLAQSLVNKQISIDDFSKYTNEAISLWSAENVIDKLRQYNMEIVSATLQGTKYEITAQRPK